MNLSKRSFVVSAGGAIILLVALAVFLMPRGTDDSSSSVREIVPVRRGTLIATVSATGALSPLREAALAFSANGPIVKLQVKQGDTVKANQVLAQLDTRALDLQVAQAEASLQAAEAKIEQIKNPSAADVAAAQANVSSAEAALAQLKTPTQTDLTIAKSDVEKARAALDRAQADYDRIGGSSNPFIATTPQALALQQASLDYQKALAVYNSRISPNDSQLKQAVAAVEQARAALTRLTTPNPNDLKSAQANVEQARAARDLAIARLDDAVIRAPFDGVVTHIDFDLGSFVQAGRVVIGVADTSELRVKLNIDETDISRIEPGQAVTIGLDAYPEATINARVTEVAAMATTTQGVVNYIVTVTIDPGDIPVRIGMTANANIEVANKENVLLVPNRAVRAANSKRFVTIQKADGQTEEIEVQLGLANEQETEVVSGLQEGQPVVISAAQINPALSPFGGRR